MGLRSPRGPGQKTLKPRGVGGTWVVPLRSTDPNSTVDKPTGMVDPPVSHALEPPMFFPYPICAIPVGPVRVSCDTGAPTIPVGLSTADQAVVRDRSLSHSCGAARAHTRHFQRACGRHVYADSLRQGDGHQAGPKQCSMGASATVCRVLRGKRNYPLTLERPPERRG